MLETLRCIVQEVSSATNLDQALTIVVRRVKEATAVDVCSVYLIDPGTDQYVLMATDGLYPESVGRVRLARNQGLIGLVGERQEPINLEDAQEHPRYRYFPETGEERYHAFLGTPIIHYRQVVGVLVIQQTEKRRFNKQELDFFVTIGTQLAGAMDHALVSGGASRLLDRQNRGAGFIQGVQGAPGVAIGTGVLLHPLASLESIPDRKIQDIEGEDIEREENAFRIAVAKLQEELRQNSERMTAILPAEGRALFDVYIMLLGSNDRLVTDTVQRIRAGNWAPGAWRDTINEHARIFDQVKDSYLRTRAEDIRDLGRRLLTKLRSAEEDQRHFPERCILIGDDISVAQIAEVPVERLAGIVCLHGSTLSHAAILARSVGIPAVMGLGDCPLGHLEGREIIVDGHQGRVYLQPSTSIIKEYRRLMEEEQELSTELKELHDLPSVTADGVSLPLYVKAGLLADITPVSESGAEGIGLYRTEFAFMVRQSFPSEEEQYQTYRQVLQSFAPKPVVMRTLDVGGDKPLPYFPINEKNPFLSWRGIRITLDHPEIFLTQLRAMLRANAGMHNLNILFPMISSIEEVDETLALLERAHHQLSEEGLPSAWPAVGVMIEVPAAVYLAASLARRVDFLSIGTNDLTQYLLAVDRDNPQVAGLFDSLHPAVIEAVHTVIRKGHQCHKPVSLCGEMAGDPAAVILLLGMGIDSLGVTASSLPRIKWVIRSFTQRRAHELLNQALEMENAAAIRRLLNSALEQVGLDRIIKVRK